MTKEKLLKSENGIETDLELPNSLKDKNISLEHLLKEMNQSKEVEELINRYGLSIENLNKDELGQVNQIEPQEVEVNFQPISNKMLNSKREKIFKRWVYLAVFIFAVFLGLAMIGAYIDFYNYYITNDADYLELQMKKNNQSVIEVEEIEKLNQPNQSIKN